MYTDMRTVVHGASRSACRFCYVSELTTRGTAPPLSSIAGPSIEQRGYKKVHWKERGLNTLAESSRLFLVLSVLSLEMKGTSPLVSLLRMITIKAVAAIVRSFTAD